MRERRTYQVSTTNLIVGVGVLVLGLMLLFWLARSIFTILAFAAPLLLVATLVINHRIVLNYGKWVWNLLQNNFFSGLLAVLFTVIGFPIVCFLLFGRALLQRKVQQISQEFQQQEQGSFTSYEDVSEEMEILELPPQQEAVRTDDVDYEELFD